MADDDYLSLDIMKPGVRIEVIGNVTMVKFDTEDDAILFAEMLKDMEGKDVVIRPREKDNES